jgi:hypothetical protein
MHLTSSLPPSLPPSLQVGRSSDHKVCQVHNHTLYRTTSVVENGPFYSVSQQV